MIRVSGVASIALCDRLFRTKRSLTEKQGNTLSYGVWCSASGAELDEVVVGLFRAPHSFTGEDTVEVTCHGSLFIQQEIMRSLVEIGCRVATAGEFTQRAFLNGKMDLSQAEAVADLIASSSEATHRLALNQMRGEFSSELKILRNQLLEIVALLELELDFGEEDVEFADRGVLCNLAESIGEVINRLVDSFRIGNAIKQGIPVAIIGETNVGKSTLLNRLLHDEKAIVSSIHGTTRDVIEDTVVLQGVTFRFIDTAGIRETTDEIESIGIRRTFKKMEQASIILWVIDSSRPFHQAEQLQAQVATAASDKKLLIVVNKADMLSEAERHALATQLASHPHLFLSAKTDKSLNELEARLIELAQLPQMDQNDVIVTNLRHYESLVAAQSSLQRVTAGLSTHLSGDFVSQDLRECLHHLSTITGGEITTDEILGAIFSRFCIGK